MEVEMGPSVVQVNSVSFEVGKIVCEMVLAEEDI
jgi:hypothetical protein